MQTTFKIVCQLSQICWNYKTCLIYKALQNYERRIYYSITGNLLTHTEKIKEIENIAIKILPSNLNI